MAGTRVGPGAALAGESYMIPDTLSTNLKDSATWDVTISRLCAALKLPNLTTRHGLKRVHARFNEIYKKLNGTYTVAKRENNEKAMGAVVGVMAKMCADALLRDKLFEKGILEKIMPLLEFDLTRHLALNALAMVTHHGGLGARQEIARQNKTLVRLIQEHPDDPRVAELAIVTLYHATAAIVGNEEPPRLALLKEIGIQPVLDITVATLRKPTTSFALLTHAFNLVVCASQHCSNQCKSVPGLIALIAGFMRSNSINARACALGGLLRLPISECEPDAQHILPQKLMEAATRGPPAHLLNILFDYGMARGELYIMSQAMSEYANAMTRVVQNRDMYALGKKLADLIQRAEYVIAEGGFQCEDGYILSERDGVPFTRWTDALPIAAKALRERGSKEDLDAADIVDLKFFILRQRYAEANALGQAAIKRNPRLAYAYYIMSIGADTEHGLRAVKKGLKCPNATPFVRNQMLWRAVTHAAERGLRILQESREGDTQTRAEGSAFLMSAWEDSKTFISEAPPDTRHMLGIVGWYVLLTAVVKGPELSEDLRELDLARAKIKTSMEFMHFVGHPVKRTQVNITCDLLFSFYSVGARQWGSLVKRYDELEACIYTDTPLSTSSAQADDDLAEWLGNVDISDCEDDEHREGADHHHNTCRGHGTRRRRGEEPNMATSSLSYELYRCSWCGNPSAVLRRCGGCGKTRYCDGGCQKSHWSEHKADCKGR